MATVGEQEAIEFFLILNVRTPNTVDAQREYGFAQGRDRQDSVVEAPFRIYFTDIEYRRILHDLADAERAGPGRSRGLPGGRPIR